ncbi:efflux RND transporter permease subunit [Candidatus Latescibacterota bacterium]
MNITRAAIEKNRITIVVLIALIIGGMLAYKKMPRAEDPGFVIRVAVVMTFFPGSSPERVEMLVTDKLEKTIQEMPELDNVQSESKTGFSMIYVVAKQKYSDMDPIWDDLRRKVEKASNDLPEGIIGPIVNDDFGDVYGIIATLTGEGYSPAELKEVADEIRDEVLLIPEAAKVEIVGAQEERVFVEYSNARLTELGLSPLQLQNMLETRNIIIPGGHITNEYERIVLEPSGNYESIDDLRRTVIKIPDRDEVVYLEYIAEVSRGYIDPPASKMRVSGVSGLGIAVSMTEGSNIILLGEKIKALFREFEATYPIGIDFNFTYFQPDTVESKVNDFVSNLIQAIVIVMGVMLVTLGVRTGLVVASLVPVTMIMTLLVMSIFNLGINQVTLAALIIALGMLVDNAIVMSENIMVQIKEGKKPVIAAIDSALELRIPLLVASLTTAAAFLPFYLAEGDMGEYVGSLFTVVTMALLCSWILSLTMIPLLCVKFIKVKSQDSDKKENYNSKFYLLYRRFLLILLRHRYSTVACTAVIFILAMYAFGFVPAIFFPNDDKPVMTAEFSLPLGTPIERTEKVVTEIEEFISDELLVNNAKEEGIKNWTTFIGESAPRFVLAFNPEPSKPGYAMLIINTTSNEIIPELIEKLETFCYDNFPDVRPKVDFLPMGGVGAAAVEVRVTGRDSDTVFQIVNTVKEKLAEIYGTKNIRDNWGERTKKILVNINQARARRAGLTSQDIAISLKTILTGIQTTEYRENDEVIPVILRTVEADRRDISKLENHQVYAQMTGNSVPLSQVADLELAWEPSKILRRNRMKTVTVQTDVNPDVSPLSISADLRKWLLKESESWPVGYSFEIGGESEGSEQANQSIADQLPTAFFIILILLVSQFNSFRKTSIILCTIPLGLIGVVIGLIIFRSYFGFMTLLGVVSLAGIVINNAIVLLDRIKLEIDDNGLEPQKAVVVAAQRRLRPILLTTATTVCGLLPLYLGGGVMWEPMAVSIMSGLVFATVLTLGFVPVMYSILYRVNYKGFKTEI